MLVHEIAQYNAAKQRNSQADAGAINAGSAPVTMPPKSTQAPPTVPAPVPVPASAPKQPTKELFKRVYADKDDEDNLTACVLGSGSFGEVRKGTADDCNTVFDIAIKQAKTVQSDNATEMAYKAATMAKEAAMLQLIYGFETFGVLEEMQVKADDAAPGMPDVVGVWDDMIVTRFYERPLDLLLEKQTLEIAPPHAVGIMKSLVKAVVWLHSKGVAHCDIKPGNVMYRQGTGIGEGFGILIDFGSAAKDDVNRTTQDSTPLYLAPHMRYTLVGSYPFRGCRPDDRTCTLAELMRADAYALGLVAWELLYRLRYNAYDAREMTYRKYNPRLHWGPWEPAALHHDDSGDVAAIASTAEEHEKVLQQCVHFCCIDIDQAESAAALLERATVYARDYGDDGSVGPDADLAAYKRTALHRGLGAIELFYV